MKRTCLLGEGVQSPSILLDNWYSKVFTDQTPKKGILKGANCYIGCWSRKLPLSGEKQARFFRAIPILLGTDHRHGWGGKPLILSHIPSSESNRCLWAASFKSKPWKTSHLWSSFLGHFSFWALQFLVTLSTSLNYYNCTYFCTFFKLGN